MDALGCRSNESLRQNRRRKVLQNSHVLTAFTCVKVTHFSTWRLKWSVFSNGLGNRFAVLFKSSDLHRHRRPTIHALRQFLTIHARRFACG